MLATDRLILYIVSKVEVENMQVSIKIQSDGQAVIPAEVIYSIGGRPGAALAIDLNIDHATLRIDTNEVPPRSIYTQDIAPDKSVQDFLDGYEKKYHMTSANFWQKYKAGELEYEVEFIDWAGHYEHKLYLDSIGVDPSAVMFERFTPQGENGNDAS